ncbi:MAG: hypothetical protein AB200_02340 [Parcubacteria bacterium C7867-005]|nr:MAG: hypothetical protein AB200_02340 [Parcubacteria bacterium C7867-005]
MLDTKQKKILLLGLGLFMAPLLSHAQFSGINIDQADTTTVEVTPLYPGGNTETRLEMTDASFDIDSSLIEWVLNNRAMTKGVGLKFFEFTTRGVGNVDKVDVFITPSNKNRFKKTINIIPTEIDLVWQSDSYVPPFYRGKPLYSYQNKVTVFALTKFIDRGGREIPGTSLVYRWSRNGQVVSTASGYGKSSFGLENSIYLRDEVISVNVRTEDNSIVGEKEITLKGTAPKVLVYENHPLYGILYNKEVSGEFELKDKEVTFTASPYYFGTRSLASDLGYKWLINNVSSGNNFVGPSATFRQEGSGSGVSQVTLKIDHSSKYLQSASKSFRLKFGEILNEAGI